MFFAIAFLSYDFCKSCGFEATTSKVSYIFNTGFNRSLKQLFRPATSPAVPLAKIVLHDVSNETGERDVACSPLLAEIVVEAIIFDECIACVALVEQDTLAKCID